MSRLDGVESAAADKPATRKEERRARGPRPHGPIAASQTAAALVETALQDRMRELTALLPSLAPRLTTESADHGELPSAVGILQHYG